MGLYTYWDLVGVGPSGFGTEGFRTGLDNIRCFIHKTKITDAFIDKMDKIYSKRKDFKIDNIYL